jgi:hypothetical protein
VDHKEKPIPGVRRSFTLDYGDPVTLAPKPPMAKPKDKEKDPNAPLTMTDAVPCSFTFSKWVSLKAFELKVSLRCRCLCASADPHALRPGDEEKSDLLIEAKGG